MPIVIKKLASGGMALATTAFASGAVILGAKSDDHVNEFPADRDDLIFYFVQALALAAIIGNLIAYRRHRNIFPPLVAIISASAIIYGINAGIDTYYIYPGLLGLLIVSILNSRLSAHDKQINS